MLDSVEVWPVKTNAGFLFTPCSITGLLSRRSIDTGFIDRNLDAAGPDSEPDDVRSRCRGLGCLILRRGRSGHAGPLGGLSVECV